MCVGSWPRYGWGANTDESGRAGRAYTPWDNRRMIRSGAGHAGILPQAPVGRAVAIGIAFAVAYVLLDRLSYIHPLEQYGITPWNPQPALAIALLVVGGQRWLPVVFGAVVAAEWVVRGAPAGMAATLYLGAVLALAYAAIARALTGPFAIDPALGSRRHTVRLVAVVTIGALLAGMLYLAALASLG